MIALDQFADASGSGVSLSVTLPGNSTAGNLYAAWGNDDNVITMTDNASTPNTYTVIGTDSAFLTTLLYAKNITVPVTGATTMTATHAGGGFAIGLVEFSGADESAPLDKSASAHGSGSPLSSGTMTPSVNGELVYGVIATPGGFGYSPGAGFTNLNNISNMASGDQYLVQSTAAAITVNCTFSIGGVTWGVVAATFKPAGGVVGDVIFDNMNF